ncbi:MAG: hypothetical protein ABI432_03130 [Flavobacteriales bacterium]
MSTELITLRAFRAVDDPGRCAMYVSEHTKVLEDIGVFNVLKPDMGWCSDPNVVVLVAEHPVLGMVAGIRVHKASFGVELPMQRSIAALDRSIAGRLAELLPDGNAEIAGLWNAHRFSGHGIPMLLMESAVSVASQIGVRSLVTFIAEYVAPYASRTGFIMMDSLKNGGDFVYPVPGIRTHAMILPDVLTMTAAKPGDRHRILSLRLRPYQLRAECPKQTPFGVRYELLDPSPCTDEVAGRNLHAA